LINISIKFLTGTLSMVFETSNRLLSRVFLESTTVISLVDMLLLIFLTGFMLESLLGAVLSAPVAVSIYEMQCTFGAI